MLQKFIWPALMSTLLGGCGSYTTPAAVRMADGRLLTGTTTASLSAGRFKVTDAKTGLTCSGNYDPLSTASAISAPVACSDGRVGKIDVNRTPDGLSGSGSVQLADGSSGRVAFGSLATSVLAEPPPQVAAVSPSEPQFDPIPVYAVAPDLPEPNSSQVAYAAATPSVATPSTASTSGYSSPQGSTSSGCRSENYYGSISCVTGAPRTSYVRGYTRKNGTYVSGYYRSRRR